MKEIIITRINDIKKHENDFLSEHCKNVYFASSYEMPVLISNVIINNLTDDDLARFFEYVIRMQADIVEARVKKEYFSQK